MSSLSTQDGSDTRQSLLEYGRTQLEGTNRDAPHRAAEWILLDLVGCDRHQLYTQADARVEPEQARQFRDLVQRYRDGEPLQHVLGYASFRGLRIEVSPDVMIPRPETEEVVGCAIDAIASRDAPRILDVGTGSGCIALALKDERPDAYVQAWDVSAAALDVARSNARRLDLNVKFDQVDLFADGIAECVDAPVDLLVANPPYIPKSEADTLSPTVRDYDPDLALFSGDDPLRFYRGIASRVPLLCASRAAIVLETHADYAEDAATVLRNRGLVRVRVRDDLQGRPRILTAKYVPSSDD